MFTVVVASQKGGAGKTTLARNLAVAAGAGAALVDTDPQGSLTDWWNRREAGPPALARLDGDMAASLAALAKPAEAPQRGAAAEATPGAPAAKGKLRTMTLRLEEADYQRLREFAFRRGLSHQAVLLAALRGHLEDDGAAAKGRREAAA